VAVRSDKPRKATRPEFVGTRIAELQRQLSLEKNENRRTELQDELSEWQRIRPKQKPEIFRLIREARIFQQGRVAQA
jgi:hypothetical protein